MANTITSVLFIRCPDNLLDWLQTNAKEKGFRSKQEYALQILRERKELELAENAEASPISETNLVVPV